MSAAAIKKIDKAKNDLLKKVDVLVAKKKKLYSNMDITSAKSAEEKKLDKEISDLFSKINALVVEKRKLTNFGSMPIKKKTTAVKKPAALGPKAKLMKLAVTTLRTKAKKLGISDVSKRTKENLVQSIILGEARKKKGTAAGKKATAKRKVSATRQTGSSSAAKDRARKALAPGRRVSKTGSVYYERRKNRSDKAGQLLGGSKRDYIEDIGDRIINDYLKYDENYDFGDAFNEVIDSYEVYYNKQWKVVYDLGYYDWSDNDLGIQPKDVGEVMYLALYELYGDVESYVEDNK
jgi:hypothetical protein